MHSLETTFMASGLNTCPVELVSYICSLACTDDGATAKALSLISRSFYAICVPLRYQTISLHKREHILRFSALLVDLPSHLRRIYHLYISLDALETTVDIGHLNHVFQIIQLASSTLESLTFVYPNTIMSSSSISRLFRTPFPNLRELTVHGFYPFPDSSTTHMPRLERLHLSGNRNPYGLLHLNCLNDSFTSLTHLRVSGLLMACSFVMELDLALQVARELRPSEEADTAVDVNLRAYPAGLPPKLERLFVQPGHHQAARATVSGAKKDELMMTRLRSIIRLQDDWVKIRKGEGDLRVTLGERSGLDSAEVSMRDVLYRDWRSRLDGEAGCW